MVSDDLGEPTLDAFLGGRLLLAQPRAGYRAGLDAVLLAATVPRTVTTAADLGAGVGAVGLAVARRLAASRVTLIEREPALASLAADNVARNDLGLRVRVVTLDVEAMSEVELAAAGLAAASFDAVLANPPFQTEGEGRAPPDPLRARAHVMAAGGIERWARAMARLARPDGLAAVIHRADAMGELLQALGGRFGALTVLPVHPRSDAAAVRVVVAGRKGSRAPLRVLPGLVVHGDAGHGFAATLEAVLRHGAGLDLWAARAPLLVPSAGVA